MLNDRVDAKEVSDASQLPYSQQISQTIVVTEAGDYTATLQVHGISCEVINALSGTSSPDLERTRKRERSSGRER